jgi:hypothetical protein
MTKSRFDTVAPAPPLKIGSMSRAEPIRARTYESDAGVLFVQSGIVGGLLAALIIVGLLFPVGGPGRWAGEWEWSSTLVVIKIALMVGLLVTLALFGWLAYTSRELLWKREHMQAQPDAIPPGPPDTCRIEVDLRSFNGHLRKAWLDIPVPAESFATFARATLNGQPVAVSRWTGTGKPFSRSEFETMRDWLIELSLAEWLDTRHREQGWRFTRAGRHVLDKWLAWHASMHVHGQVTENEAVHGPEGE